nr:MAG TPA: hypothetical protein [Caudoviricetes sp.]
MLELTINGEWLLATLYIYYYMLSVSSHNTHLY